MNVKIDTKEKFTVITPIEASLTANMTEKFREKLLEQKKKECPHLVLKLTEVAEIEAGPANMIAEVQNNFYEENLSFVICGMQKPVEKVFEEEELLDTMNYTPTESEAWDIVQMEEIERELMNDFDN